MHPSLRPFLFAVLSFALLLWGTAAATAQVPDRDPTALTVQISQKFGAYLSDGNGYALYMFAKDSYGVSIAAGAVIQNWPPVLVGSSLPKLSSDVQKRLVGTTTRADGAVQLTYDGMPLYYWSKDQKAGDTLGQNVNKVWFLVAPDGSVTTVTP